MTLIEYPEAMEKEMPKMLRIRLQYHKNMAEAHRRIEQKHKEYIEKEKQMQQEAQKEAYSVSDVSSSLLSSD